MNRQNYFLGGIIGAVAEGAAGALDFLSDVPILGEFAESAATELYDYANTISPVFSDPYSFEGVGEMVTPSFFEQAGSALREGISTLSFGLLTPEDIKSGAGLLVKEGAQKALGAKRASSSQQQARAMRSQVLGAGRGIGVSGSAPARQFAPGSVRSMIARTNAGRQAFQPGTVDTRQNVVNIISDAFAQTGATTPTGAGRISPSSSKIAKVGTSYFKGKDTV